MTRAAVPASRNGSLLEAGLNQLSTRLRQREAQEGVFGYWELAPPEPAEDESTGEVPVAEAHGLRLRKRVGFKKAKPLSEAKRRAEEEFLFSSDTPQNETTTRSVVLTSYLQPQIPITRTYLKPVVEQNGNEGGTKRRQGGTKRRLRVEQNVTPFRLTKPGVVHIPHTAFDLNVGWIQDEGWPGGGYFHIFLRGDEGWREARLLKPRHRRMLLDHMISNYMAYDYNPTNAQLAGRYGWTERWVSATRADLVKWRLLQEVAPSLRRSAGTFRTLFTRSHPSKGGYKPKQRGIAHFPIEAQWHECLLDNLAFSVFGLLWARSQVICDDSTNHLEALLGKPKKQHRHKVGGCTNIRREGWATDAATVAEVLKLDIRRGAERVQGVLDVFAGAGLVQFGGRAHIITAFQQEEWQTPPMSVADWRRQNEADLEELERTGTLGGRQHGGD